MYAVSENPNPSHLRTALLLTVILHVLLAVLMPDFPKISLSSLNPLPALNIFIKKDKPEEQTFEQSLNQILPTSQELEVQEPSLGATSTVKGEEPLVSEAAPQVESLSADSDQTPPASGEPKPSTASFRIDRAFIKMFAEREVQREIERNPARLERFNRSFNSRFNQQRRNVVDSYNDQYGDIYMSVSTSVGDVCYKQEQEDGIPDDFATNTVYFFRCKSKPFKFELDPPLDTSD